MDMQAAIAQKFGPFLKTSQTKQEEAPKTESAASRALPTQRDSYQGNQGNNRTLAKWANDLSPALRKTALRTFGILARAPK